jgi:hypothetical protein
MRQAIASATLPDGRAILYGGGIRKDPVQIRVAIPAADPPDNNRTFPSDRALAGARIPLPCAIAESP